MAQGHTNPPGRDLLPSVFIASKLSICSMLMAQVPLGRKKNISRWYFIHFLLLTRFAALWQCPSLLPLTTERIPVTVLGKLLRFSGTRPL